MMNLNNPNENLINELVNYLFVKQNQFNTYFKSFPQKSKDIRKIIKTIDNEKMFLKYNIKDKKIDFVAIYFKNDETLTIEIILISTDEINLVELFKQTLKQNHQNYTITIVLSKFNYLLEQSLNDDFFTNHYSLKKFEIYESKLNKIKYRINEDFIIQELPDYMKEELKTTFKCNLRKCKKTSFLVCLYNNQLIGYFKVKNQEEYVEVLEYAINPKFENNEIIYGKAFVYIFDKFGKYKNIQLFDYGYLNSDVLITCGCLLIEENYLFSTKNL